MKQVYRVEFFMEEGGYVNIQADSEEDAKTKVYNTLVEFGVDKLDNPDVTHRDMQTMSVMEVK